METMSTVSPIRILLVEDNEHDRLAFRRAFQKSDVECEITECVRAEEALERLRTGPSFFDLVVVDQGLPGMCGLELCKEILDKEMSLPLVLLTGKGSEELAVEALTAGVDDYMVKDSGGGYLDLLPVVLPQALRKYGDRLARKQAEEELRKAYDELEQRVEERTAELAEANEQLKKEIEERKQAEEALRKAHDDLELRVEERTAELIKANEQLKCEIEDRKRAEQELKLSEEKYRLLFTYDPNPLFLVDSNSSRILDVNTPAVMTYQYERKELLGMSFLDLFDADEADRLPHRLGECCKDVYLFIPKATAKKKDGSYFSTNLHTSAVKFDEPGKGDFGQSLIVRTVDISRRLERDAVLAQTGKMATLGEMAAGVAHEINQPLNVIQVGVDFLSKMIKRKEKIPGEELLKVNRNIIEQVDRATSIINHLREFGRKSDLEVYPVDLNKPIRGVFTLLGQQLKVRDMEVNLKLDEGLPKILAENNRLEQVFLNLVTNARDAMELKGPEATKVLTITTYQEGDKVLAVVSDTGTGMSEGIAKKIFDPFFTTKEAGKGTGLGLSITYNLVKDFNGDIEVESTPDVGTKFTMSFPVYKEERRSP
jgi:PAS domain S-box-containing protein